MVMEYRAAATTVMPFGKYQGQTLDRIAEKDAGLRYLDWLRGERQADEKRLEFQTTLTEALCTYLEDPTIKSELQKALSGGEELRPPKRYR